LANAQAVTSSLVILLFLFWAVPEAAGASVRTA
jgi:hypothetical protein